MNENNPTPTEVPPGEVPPENPVPPPPAPAPVPTPQPAPPPAAKLVIAGEVKSENEIALEKKLKVAETRAAELERDNQELKKIPTTAPVKKEKRWRMPQPLIGSEEDDE